MTQGNPHRPSAVVLIGLGLMGCDIAAIFLSGAYRVTAVEPATERWPSGRERVQRSLAQIGGEPNAASELAIVGQIGEVDWADSVMVIECAPENLGLKQRIFGELDERVPETIPIGTNASGLRITDIARNCRTRTRMANLHFFLPAHLVPAVEVVKGEFTEEWVCDHLAEVMRALGRVPIRVARDVPGFLANRIQHALMREAFAVIDEGLGTAEDVDAAVRFGFGFRYVAAGPMLQKELAGLDTQLAAAQAIYPSLNNSTEPSPTLQGLVRDGKFGTKTGQGFRPWPLEVALRERERYERVLLAAARLLRDDTEAAG